MEFVEPATGAIDIALVFSEWQSDLEPMFGRVAHNLIETGRLWVRYPKKASRRATDLDFDSVQRLGIAYEMVDTKVCAIDGVWTGICFMVRTADRVRWKERRETE